MSDVPVGAFCSGGVDSSLVTALAARHNHDIQAFNVSCPDDPSVDEGPYAAMMAKHVGVKLHTVNLTREEFRRALVPTVWASEYPLAYVHTVPLYLLARLARDSGVKVLLSGEGADEVFGGYTGQYRQNAVSRIVRSKGRLAGSVLRRGISIMERVGGRIGMRPATNGAPPMMHEVLTGGLRRWETKKCAAALFDRLGDALDRDLAAELLTQMQTYLLPLLHRADRASMLASVESRVPFLDPDLVRIGLSVPPGMKVEIDGLRPVGKAILKKITREVIPEKLIYRPKMGFTVPSSMYRGSWPEEWLQDGFVVSEFNIQPASLRTWLEAQDDETVAWMLSVEIWGQLFIRGRSVADVSAQYQAESN
jgi:asparagine synthase (glutamine-hydrolysing)